MRNHRDFYRLLHVRPDAPAAVIKASYRAMMQKLRYHPDLGGDEGDARLLNEAMRTLGDPVSRAVYDASLNAPTTAPEGHRPPPQASAGTPSRTERPRATPDFGIAHCRFCNASRVDTWTPATGYESVSACSRCGGPTRSVERFVASVSAERRRLDRRARGGSATLWTRWPLEGPLAVELMDLSITGCALENVEALRPAQVVLLNTAVLDAIAEVRFCQRSADGRGHRGGLAFLTVQTHARPGDVYSGQA